MEDNIKVFLREIRWGCMDWINVETNLVLIQLITHEDFIQNIHFIIYVHIPLTNKRDIDIRYLYVMTCFNKISGN